MLVVQFVAIVTMIATVQGNQLQMIPNCTEITEDTQICIRKNNFDLIYRKCAICIHKQYTIKKSF